MGSVEMEESGRVRVTVMAFQAVRLGLPYTKVWWPVSFLILLSKTRGPEPLPAILRPRTKVINMRSIGTISLIEKPLKRGH